MKPRFHNLDGKIEIVSGPSLTCPVIILMYYELDPDLSELFSLQNFVSGSVSRNCCCIHVKQGHSIKIGILKILILLKRPHYWLI